MNVHALAIFPTGYLEFRYLSSVFILYKSDMLAVFFVLCLWKGNFSIWGDVKIFGACIEIRTHTEGWRIESNWVLLCICVLLLSFLFCFVVSAEKCWKSSVPDLCAPELFPLSGTLNEISTGGWKLVFMFCY